MSIYSSAITAAALVCLVATSLPAQEAAQDTAQQIHRRKGYWASFGAGGGWSTTPPFSADGGFLRGGSGYLRMGGTVNRQLLIGGEALVWWREDDGFGPGQLELTRVNVTATALFYPDAEFDLFVKGGFGISSIEHGVGNDTDGIGVTGGVGYDLRIGNNLYVTPNVDGMVHFLQSFTEWSIVVTMGLTWH